MGHGPPARIIPCDGHGMGLHGHLPEATGSLAAALERAQPILSLGTLGGSVSDVLATCLHTIHTRRVVHTLMLVIPASTHYQCTYHAMKTTTQRSSCIVQRQPRITSVAASIRSIKAARQGDVSRVLSTGHSSDQIVWMQVAVANQSERGRSD